MITDFARQLEKFFNNFLVKEFNVSKHTIRAYRDSFSLLIEFMNDEKLISPDYLELKHLDRNVVLDFLSWLEIKHNNGISTRNQRCAAIKSFCKFLIFEDPGRMAVWQSIRSIKLKKSITKTITYLSVDAIKLILDQIPYDKDLASRRDLALVGLLYDSAARAQEIVDLTPSDIRFEKPCKIRLIGKGNKQRLIPVLEEQISVLKQYMRDFNLDLPENAKKPLFSNRMGEKLTTAGVAYVLKKYVDATRLVNSEIIPENISPHTFRHSKAMHLLQAGIILPHIRDFLGHSSVQTTEIYARADSKHKREALEAVYVDIFPPTVDKLGSWEREGSKLKAFLKSLK